MRFPGLSARSKVLFWAYSVFLTVGVAIVLALVIAIVGYLAGWERAPIPDISGQLVAFGLYGIVPMLALRFALIRSIRKDRAGPDGRAVPSP